MVSLIRKQLMNYIDIYPFLEDQEGCWRNVIGEDQVRNQNFLFT
ncbi:hypothetical protein ADIARSV_2922 [Arcticibacter svalbardensis MN12-7]|uniref:Uncharacterized protein n=1 Tax=Arcticibacter svalbardensis MN12-7 TaxID=1150600 RepID=R9GY64_9SPHI|nr:hypothetical protein ADIARSV_2922 [Arcticibacter svalbardensis MN12-7]